MKFAAALALSKMLSNSVAQTFLKSHLRELLEIYLKIMDEIDSEELIGALEGIMEKF